LGPQLKWHITVRVQLLGLLKINALEGQGVLASIRGGAVQFAVRPNGLWAVLDPSATAAK
jgi:hypothetical protein